MNEVESMKATAREILTLAGQHEVDLAPMFESGTFLHEGRILWFWRKGGIIHYSTQGRIHDLPREYQASAGLFHGMWHETGTLADLDSALAFLKAWLMDKKEVQDLPLRCVRSTGIG